MLCSAGFAAAAINREPACVVRVISTDKDRQSQERIFPESSDIQSAARGKWEEIKLIGPEAPQTALNDQAYEEALKNSSTPDQVIRRGLQATEYVKGLLRNGGL